MPTLWCCNAKTPRSSLSWQDPAMVVFRRLRTLCSKDSELMCSTVNTMVHGQRCCVCMTSTSLRPYHCHMLCNAEHVAAQQRSARAEPDGEVRGRRNPHFAWSFPLSALPSASFASGRTKMVQVRCGAGYASGAAAMWRCSRPCCMGMQLSCWRRWFVLGAGRIQVAPIPGGRAPLAHRA